MLDMTFILTVMMFLSAESYEIGGCTKSDRCLILVAEKGLKFLGCHMTVPSFES